MLPLHQKYVELTVSENRVCSAVHRVHSSAHPLFMLGSSRKIIKHAWFGRDLKMTNCE